MTSRSPTRVGMPAADRQPMTRARLTKLAQAGSRVSRKHGAPNIAAICDALLFAFAENDRLHRLLADGWDEPTRRQDRPDLAARSAMEAP